MVMGWSKFITKRIEEYVKEQTNRTGALLTNLELTDIVQSSPTPHSVTQLNHSRGPDGYPYARMNTQANTSEAARLSQQHAPQPTPNQPSSYNSCIKTEPS